MKNEVVVLSQLLTKKHSDYGEDNLKKFGEVGIVIRVNDKIERLKQLTKSKEAKVTDESISDTWLDIAGYAVQAIIMLENIDNNDWESKLNLVLEIVNKNMIKYSADNNWSTLDRLIHDFLPMTKYIGNAVDSKVIKVLRKIITSYDNIQLQSWYHIANLALLGYKEIVPKSIS